MISQCDGVIIEHLEEFEFGHVGVAAIGCEGGEDRSRIEISGIQGESRDPGILFLVPSISENRRESRIVTENGVSISASRGEHSGGPRAPESRVEIIRVEDCYPITVCADLRRRDFGLLGTSRQPDEAQEGEETESSQHCMHGINRGGRFLICKDRGRVQRSYRRIARRRFRDCAFRLLRDVACDDFRPLDSSAPRFSGTGRASAQDLAFA